jgi:ribosome recycling factor
MSTVRTGKASPALVENIDVEAYGTQMKLKQLALITTPEARLLVIQPFDIGTVQAIEKAIKESNIGINPNVDGKIIRLPIPALTEQRRKEIARQVKATGEEYKVGIRNERRDANEKLKQLLKDKAITEDDNKRATERVQKETDAGIAQVDDVVSKKEKEVLEV